MHIEKEVIKRRNNHRKQVIRTNKMTSWFFKNKIDNSDKIGKKVPLMFNERLILVLAEWSPVIKQQLSRLFFQMRVASPALGSSFDLLINYDSYHEPCGCKAQSGGREAA